MTISEFYHKLAIERCRMYVAQLCAAHHLDEGNVAVLELQQDTMASLLKGLSQDLQVLEEFFSGDVH